MGDAKIHTCLLALNTASCPLLTNSLFLTTHASKPAADAAACCRCHCDWPTNRMMNL